MRYHVLAADYDGTLARHGEVAPATLAALQRLKSTGRRLVLVTGRELGQLLEIFKGIEVCDLVVAENGAVLYDPRTRETDLLCAAPPAAFVADLRGRLSRLSIGHAIVATWRPHEVALLNAIRRHGLELQVIFNKDAVMVLPSGVNKATGFAAALRRLKLSPRNAVAVGDAENDHALFEMCECGAAVANSVPALLAHADLILKGDHGQGVEELVAQLLEDDLALAGARLRRHDIPIGTRAGGQGVSVPAHGSNLVIVGSSGAGKTTLASGLLDRIGARGYQFLVLDSKGDYGAFEGAVNLGDSFHTPSCEEVLSVLASDRAVVNLQATRAEDRPRYVAGLLARVQKMRARSGRPHWIVVDEAHSLMPLAASTSAPLLEGGVLLVTAHPDRLPGEALAGTTLTLAKGAVPLGRILESDEALASWRGSTEPPFIVKSPWSCQEPRHDARRHRL
jgi:hydroxymethylpyrimidine pyrophosphatase-like HAD family hydrolase